MIRKQHRSANPVSFLFFMFWEIQVKGQISVQKIVSRASMFSKKFYRKMENTWENEKEWIFGSYLLTVHNSYTSCGNETNSSYKPCLNSRVSFAFVIPLNRNTTFDAKSGDSHNQEKFWRTQKSLPLIILRTILN